jgi:pyruvate kinase
VELRPEEVPLIQKEISHRANRAFKPVITATQMLESMTAHPRATRAEVSDIANAILDGTDAVMLSAETASGGYPIEAVTTMARTAENAEEFFVGRDIRGRHITSAQLTSEAVSIAACELANDTGAKLMVVPTASGWSARAVARHRLRRPIVALTENPRVARELALTWGVQPFSVARYRTVDDMIKLAKQFVLSQRLARRGEKMVITAGLPLHQPGGTNMIQIQTL